MKALAIASLTTMIMLIAGCDHMMSKDSDHSMAKGSTMDAPTSATTTSSSNQPATTRGDPMTGDATWDRLDSNQDGYLSKDELMGSPGVAQNYEKIDTDGDGRISLAEWKAYGHH